jgi:hypothetical protein
VASYVHIPEPLSLAIVVSLLLGSTAASLIITPRSKGDHPSSPGEEPAQESSDG